MASSKDEMSHLPAVWGTVQLGTLGFCQAGLLVNAHQIASRIEEGGENLRPVLVGWKHYRSARLDNPLCSCSRIPDHDIGKDAWFCIRIPIANPRAADAKIRYLP